MGGIDVWGFGLGGFRVIAGLGRGVSLEVIRFRAWVGQGLGGLVVGVCGLGLGVFGVTHTWEHRELEGLGSNGFVA